MRVFVAIDMPPPVRAALGRVQAALPFGRATDEGQLHLTLAFLGEQPDAMVEAAHDALSALSFAPFELQPQGLGSFGGDVLWAGMRDAAPVVALHGRVLPALHGAGIVLERRRFRPHVTLARFDRPDPPRLAAFLQAHAAFPCPAFAVTGFGLWRSTLTEGGAVHEELARYPAAGMPPVFG
jgi:2'-5' RNA ligase